MRHSATLLAVGLMLTACGSPANATSGAPPATVVANKLHVVHSPGHVTDDAHLKAGQCHARGKLPDPACTPGAIDPAVTQANIATTICRIGYTATIRPPQSETGPWKKKLMADYGVTGTAEFDHLVPLELGGANATSNLWPEAGAIPNPKDGTEGHLRALVCAGKLTLAAAQKAIAADWTKTP